MSALCWRAIGSQATDREVHAICKVHRFSERDSGDQFRGDQWSKGNYTRNLKAN